VIDENADTVAEVAPARAPRRRPTAPKKATGSRRWVRVVAIGGLVALAVLARVLVGAFLELRLGDEALAAGDREGARMHFRLAGAWYAPGNPWSTAGLERLEAMAAEAREDDAEALLAWRAERSAILSAAGMYTPHADRLARANAAIAELMTQGERAAMDSERTDAELRRSYRAQLDEPFTPRPGWTLLALGGFALWVAAAFRMSQRAFDGEDRFLRPEGLRHLAVIAVGLMLFALGLTFA